MEEEIDETVSSLDEKDDEESEEQEEEERIDHPCPPSNESNSSTHTLFNFPSCLPKDECYDDCYDPVDSFEISLFDDDGVYRPENLAIRRNFYENYEYNYNINAFIDKVSAVQEEINILQEAMEK